MAARNDRSVWMKTQRQYCGAATAPQDLRIAGLPYLSDAFVIFRMHLLLEPLNSCNS